jgi:hypothetical protein
VVDRYDVGAPAEGEHGTVSGSTAIESPSLFAAGKDGPTAFEIKFLLPEAQARDVERQLAGRLRLDPFADPAFGNGYLTTSVYTDTPNFDVLMRAPGTGARKYRVRRYGLNGPVFAERKTKRGDEVRKRRSPVPDGHTAPLAESAPVDQWPCEWFRRQVSLRQLRPVCRVTYERVAFMGTTGEGDTVRATFDRNIRGMVANDWESIPVHGASLLPGQVICEFKFRVAMPVMFKTIVEEMSLTPATVSKYRLFMGTIRPVHAGSKPDA